MTAGLKAALIRRFQTAASVLKHRLPHSAKPHPRILPQRGISFESPADAGLSNSFITFIRPAVFRMALIEFLCGVFHFFAGFRI